MELYQIILIIVFSFIGLNILCFLIASLVMFNKVFKGKKLKKYRKNKSLNFNEKTVEWFDKLSKDVYINSFDNLNLSGKLLLKKDSNIFIISIHGYHGSYKTRLPIIKEIHEVLHNNILSINLRAHYGNKPNYHSLSLYESKDLKVWIEYIKSINKNAIIFLDGVSMGGATILKELSNYNGIIKGAIVDSAFYSSFDEIKYEYFKILGKGIGISMLYTTSLIYRIKYKRKLEEENNENGLNNNTVPLLFFHSLNDETVPFDQFKLNLKVLNKSCYVEVKYFKNAKHAEEYYLYKKEYIHNYLDFIYRFCK